MSAANAVLKIQALCYAPAGWHKEMVMTTNLPRIALAYDKSVYESGDRRMLHEVRHQVGLLKLGLEAFTAPYLESPASVGQVVTNSFGAEYVVADMKLHDIPNTMEAAARNLSGRFRGFTVHASSGPSGLKAVAKGRQDKLGLKSGASFWTMAFAVTVLTSHDETECMRIFNYDSKTKVVQFAYDCIEAGIDGLVCSGKELETLQEYGIADKFVTFVPGGRPAWAAAGDQKRVLTPGELARLGANYVVIGRPILKGPYPPAEAAERINDEMAEAVARGCGIG